ncbi:VOC family protein [Methylomicrobium sp. Wu6]|uniref:VOC family protein n=1 Tax=Methylomicrobium sp. Wu6 TaxID=3107928 RepID=UPI002DD64CF8|nr:VOC family protein [Methylomicrobium sp. Wu6]MEC4746971.1 VOC family protein [Methylomicrobium sp. Wu6]
MSKITPFLWFDGQAEAAANFYVSVFEGSKLLNVSLYGDGAPMPKGTVMAASFLLAGQEFIALNGGPQFTFSPAISFVVNCETQNDIDHYWEKLADGGEQLQCGWLTDRYGVSWQVVPTILGNLLSDSDVARSQRIMTAMLQMRKLDIEALKQAHRGD